MCVTFSLPTRPPYPYHCPDSQYVCHFLPTYPPAVPLPLPRQSVCVSLSPYLPARRTLTTAPTVSMCVTFSLPTRPPYPYPCPDSQYVCHFLHPLTYQPPPTPTPTPRWTLHSVSTDHTWSLVSPRVCVTGPSVSLRVCVTGPSVSLSVSLAPRVAESLCHWPLRVADCVTGPSVSLTVSLAPPCR